MMRLSLIAAFLLAALGATGANACPELPTAWRAMDTANPALSTDTLERAKTSEHCTTKDIAQISRWAALTIRKRAYQDAERLTDTEQALRDALAISGPWQVHASLGDLERERRNWAAAARAYLYALDDIRLLSEPSSIFRDTPPPEEITLRIQGFAQEMKLVSEEFVSLPGRAACQVQGLGLWAAKVVSPVRFETDSVEFTPAGAEAADELAACLAALDPVEVASVAVIGHADHRGADAYNQKLSERRAAAIVDYLSGRGIALDLKPIGKGETEPFQPDSETTYSVDDRLLMNRRVEVDVEMRN